MSERVGDAERPTPRLDDGSERHAIRLGFARGVAPSKWARRWAEAHRGGDAPALELVPLPVSGRVSEDLDIVLERVAPGSEPEGTAAEGPHGPAPTRHAVRLYTESLALVVAADHELAGAESAGRDALALVTLLGHPDHSPAWPDPEPWQDPSWAPKNAAAALELVATGLGAILLPLPLARHLSAKREHAVLLVEHDMDAVFRIADRITVMVNGAVIASDVPERIRTNPDVQGAYLGEGH